jgi:RNA polymerase primary sigma factor
MPSKSECIRFLPCGCFSFELNSRKCKMPTECSAQESREHDPGRTPTIEDDEASPPDGTATHSLLREHFGEALNGLPPREVRILQLRYGLLDGQAYTLEKVGRKMGVSVSAR